MLLVVCQLSRDVIGCEVYKTRLMRFNPSFVFQMSVGLLLVKLILLWVSDLSTVQILDYRT